MTSSKLCIAAVLASLNLVAQAGITNVPANVIPGGANSKTETRAYVGLNWSLGGSTTPELVLGVKNTKVKTGGDTTGANLAFHLNLAGGVQPGKLKLSYLDGNRNAQGELGLGFNFVTAAPLVFFGVHGPYVAFGIDAYQGPGFVPYFLLHTSDRPDEPQGGPGGLSCPAGYPFQSGSTCYSFNPA